MSQKDDVLAYLAKGPATAPEMADACAITPASLQALLSKLRSQGRVCCDGVGGRDPWRLAAEATAPADDPTMIPGGPDPACETRALAGDEGIDEEVPTADAIALAVVASARITGEDPLRIAVPDAFVRARFPAVKALAVFYPDCTWQQLGSFVGLTKLSAKVAENIPSFPWWDEVGDPAFAAAVAALEAA